MILFFGFQVFSLFYFCDVVLSCLFSHPSDVDGRIIEEGSDDDDGLHREIDFPLYFILHKEVEYCARSRGPLSFGHLCQGKPNSCDELHNCTAILSPAPSVKLFNFFSTLSLSLSLYTPFLFLLSLSPSAGPLSFDFHGVVFLSFVV